MAARYADTTNLLTGSDERNTDDDSDSLLKPGYAVFVINHKAVPSSGIAAAEFVPRNGAEKDLDHMKYIFMDRLKFEWINEGLHTNLKIDQWDHSCQGTSYNGTWTYKEDCCIRCRIHGMDHAGCFCLVISSHGREINGQQYVSFSDGKFLKLSAVYEALSDENCPTLMGKTKLIILQTCRSDLTNKENLDDKGCEVSVACPLKMRQDESMQQEQDDDDGPKKCRFTVTSVPEPDVNAYLASTSVTSLLPESKTSPLESDTSIRMEKPPNNFLCLYAVTSGKRSKRNTNDGSWMLHEMVIVLSEVDLETRVIDFMKVTTKTAQRVSWRETIVYENDVKGDQRRDVNGKLIINAERSGLKTAVCVQSSLVETRFHVV